MFTVLAERNGLVAIDKPPGWLVIPGRAPEDRRCVRDALAEQLGRRVWVCHRLDRDTSGALVMATSAEAHRVASAAFEHHRVDKVYLALVKGRLERDLDVDVPLTAGRKHTVRPARPGEEGKPARTRVSPREPLAGATLVECRPLTGRQHQIRVHLAALGHPLLVDPLYGASDDPLIDRTPLHSWEIQIPEVDFITRAPVPQDLQRALEHLRYPS